jgi:hypothetical protein
MKFCQLLLLLLAFAGSVYGQNDYSPLAKKVMQYKNSKAAFPESSLFVNAGNARSKKFFIKELEDGFLLDLNPGSLQALFKNRHETLLFEIPMGGKKAMKLELVRHEMLTGDFRVKTSEPDGTARKYQPGIYYRGVVRDEPGSLAAISVFEDEIIGVVSKPGDGNMILGKIGQGKTSSYVFYKEKDLKVSNSFDCGAEDPAIMPEILEQAKEIANTPSKSSDKCVRAYLECDYDMFVEKGSLDATLNFMTGLFNVVAALYENESVATGISEIFVWTTPDGYPTNAMYYAYAAFRNNRPDYNGDLALLVSRGAPAGGGLAALNQLCTEYAYGYTYILSSYGQLPAYSWSVNVIAHEMGHILGSQHTHSCAWNGDNTAIDGCGPAAGYDEGCAAPVPASGTIMSYCYLLNGVGIDFSKGFGQQPGDLIRNKVANAPCLASCTPPCMEIDLVSLDAGCFGEATGSLEAVPLGGEAPFSCVWSNGPETDINSNLAAGEYTVTITDAAGCEATATGTIQQPDAIDISSTVVDEAYPGAWNGAIDLSVSGGTPAYSCIWSNGAVSEDLSGLKASTYEVILTDSKGCTASTSITVNSNSCEGVISVFPYSEGFESEILLQGAGDDFDWNQHEGKTPTDRTGPNKAKEGSKYVYTEATGNSPFKTAILNSPCLDFSHLKNPALSFYYHMNGAEMGSLEVEVGVNGNNYAQVWSLSGDQSNSWKKAVIDLSAYEGSVVKIRFKGQTGTGDKSDMAIDAMLVEAAKTPKKMLTISKNDSQQFLASGSGGNVNGSQAYTSAGRAFAEDAVTLNPNPVSDELTARFTSNTRQDGTLAITNSLGQIMKMQAVNLNEGSTSIKIDVSNLGNGVYFLTLTKGVTRLTKKFVIYR